MNSLSRVLVILPFLFAVAPASASKDLAGASVQETSGFVFESPTLVLSSTDNCENEPWECW